jgi:hypothetical protein
MKIQHNVQNKYINIIHVSSTFLIYCPSFKNSGLIHLFTCFPGILMGGKTASVSKNKAQIYVFFKICVHKQYFLLKYKKNINMSIIRNLRVFYISVIFTLILLFSACKTCDCPAYSSVPAQSPAPEVIFNT